MGEMTETTYIGLNILIFLEELGYYASGKHIR